MRNTKTNIEDMAIDRLNLLKRPFIIINPSLIKIISKIKTLIIADIELPIAIPICPKPKVKARI